MAKQRKQGKIIFNGKKMSQRKFEELKVRYAGGR